MFVRETGTRLIIREVSKRQRIVFWGRGVICMGGHGSEGNDENKHGKAKGDEHRVDQPKHGE